MHTKFQIWSFNMYLLGSLENDLTEKEKTKTQRTILMKTGVNLGNKTSLLVQG